MKMIPYYTCVMRDSFGFNKVWKNSATIAYLQRDDILEFECEIEANDRAIVYGFTNREFKPSPARNRDLAGLKEIWPGKDKVCLVWIENSPLVQLYWSISDLRTIANLQPIARFDDGAVYLVTSKE